MEPAEPAAAAVTILGSYLPAIADDAVRARCSPGLRALYELVGEHLAQSGMAGVFADFALDPQLDFRVRRVLAVAVAEDAGFASHLAEAVAAARPAGRFAAPPSHRGAAAARARALRRTAGARGRAGRRARGLGTVRLRGVGGLGDVLAKFRGRF